ncbi:fucose-specific lectin [Fusarium acutatum]|uniref:Fucose-specific lectin n=1 Tax=Fusarium acutatum TaxID=78861 RepID=A0A8H4JDX0_9HYPO|nr:fucose-specific lectin [Fusarium acutatum]
MPKPNLNTDIPIPTIDSATYYDVASQQLYLAITYPNGVSFKGNAIEVNLVTSSSTNSIFVGNGPFPVNANTGTVVLPLALTLASQGGQIVAAGLQSDLFESSPPSDPWQLPTINSSPFTSPASASFNSLGSVEVTWTWIAGMGATAQQVALLEPGQPPITTIVKSPAVTATFTMAQANNMFSPGKKITFQCTPISPGLWGALANTTFSIPRSSSMEPRSLNNSPPVSSNCTIVSLPVQGTSNSQVWWGTPEGAIETAIFNRDPSQFAGPSTISDTGSCLASISVSATNQQIWWITETGAIDGQINTGNGWASPGTGAGEAIPFNVAGTASTANGGSMTSLVLEGNTGALLFWVDPKGAIGCCRWLASSGWQAVFDALPPGTANATTQLSVLSVGSSAYLFCVGPSGAVVGASWSNASSATLGLMTQFTVPSSGNAAPGGGLASFSVSAQEVAVVWTTPRNNVEMAVLNESEPFQNLQRPITVAQSVLGGTGIAAYSTGANQCSIWWIGQASDLRRTNVDLTKFRATITPNWPVFEEAGPGSCKQMRSLIAQKVSGTQVDLLYVSANDIVAGLFYTFSNGA